MKKWIATSLGLLMVSLGLFSFKHFSERRTVRSHKFSTYRSIPQGCVFLTLMGEQEFPASGKFMTPAAATNAMSSGLAWLMKAQHPSGGWGAGSHAHQDVMDPHAVPADPATTAMVGMALLRAGNTPTKGMYSTQLRNALKYLVAQVENAPFQSPTITDQTGTQIQVKLGSNIDVILTAQFLSNVLNHLQYDEAMEARTRKALNTCVAKIQQSQDQNGSFKGSGWAGVLQSSFATTALESAQAQGAAVDDDVLQRSRDFQKNNYNTETGDVKTDLGAGVVLYSVSGSTRASAKEAGRVQEEMDKAKRERRLPPSAAPTAENLERIGFDKDDAMRYATAYEVYQSAKVQAQRNDVMSGFGSNGGEEFLSYLQTGESMVIGKDSEWKKWYDNMSGRLLQIQNDDGSWSGHHCITSPVFCTATCVLILSVNEDMDLTKSYR
jgi:hypothetical protein